MDESQSTCWTVIRNAANGHAESREEFAKSYELAVRSYLKARWANSRLEDVVDDAAQEVFVECFKDGGPLNRIAENESANFRAYLYGLVRNVARRFETRHMRTREKTGLSGLDVVSDESSLSLVFDRSWARTMMKKAGLRHRELAHRKGPAAVRRVELLTLRFQQGLPIRLIADQWNVEAADLHREYAKARDEFRAALVETVRFHRPGTASEIEEEARTLLGLLA